jgi:hypothetical protein
VASGHVSKSSYVPGTYLLGRRDVGDLANTPGGEDTVSVQCPRCHGRPWEPQTWADPTAKEGGCKRCWGTGRIVRRRPTRRRNADGR